MYILFFLLILSASALAVVGGLWLAGRLERRCDRHLAERGVGCVPTAAKQKAPL